MDKLDVSLKIEKVILALTKESSDEEIKLARLEIREILQSYSGIEINKRMTLSETIEKITKHGDRQSLRTIAIIILRLLSIQNFFPSNSPENNIESIIISLMDKEITDLYKRFDIEIAAQTYIKYEKIFKIHSYCCEKLACLNQCPANIETISAEKQIILRAIGDSTVKSYLAPYEFTRIRGSIEAILTQAVEFSNTSDTMFTQRLKDLSDLLSDEREYCDSRKTFVTNDYYLPFINIVNKAIDSVAKRLRERFICEIRSRKGHSFSLDKKYPLHIKDNELRLLIPLTNTGPGIADQTIIQLNTTSNSVLILTEMVELGGIGPGDFVIPISIIVCDPVDSFTINAIISWRVIGDSEEKLIDINVRVEAQNSNVDWEFLAKSNPYSLDIAVGENFYGRKDKIKKLYSRIIQDKMNSSYITGQRRVGKSSLAKAVEDQISTSNSNLHVLNIECGDFKHPSAVGTVNSLGENIAYFLSQHLPTGFDWPETEMNGSLAALSRLLANIEKVEPNKKFVIIIDEFDEINQDLYRNSEIAQTFFLNLRSLSGKKNLCFILIGAERMSFVMSSQGEKLNKFDNISLDSFNQDDEWQDYEDLIRGGTKHSILWHDSAVRALYSMTNGHPYFTKQICSKVFDTAVKTRDSEISHEEIDIAVDDLLRELDVNAFQHFWRDGIQGNLEEIEILALKRCRVLVGVARTKRLGMKLIVENITKNIHSSQLIESEILPILTDFCRRKILAETEYGYKFIIPLFERWLINEGFNHIISDQLGDELAEKKQEEEDAAYVQDTEINDLISKWPTYRGLTTTLHTVRNWMSQVNSHKEQRILFNLLRHIRFFGEPETRQALKKLHEKIKSRIPVHITTSKAQRRKDILVTYTDGPAKSGAQFSAYYAEENLISTTCVKEISEINFLSEKNKGFPPDVTTVVIVDDFVGSGNTLSEGLTNFYNKNSELLKQADISIFVAVIAATPKGEDLIRNRLSNLDEKADLEIYESISNKHFAFADPSTIWADKSEALTAKDLCQRLGIKIDKSRPLGYNDEGLLVVFSRNCPNNTLPIIHSSGRGENLWHPLFERIKH